MNKEHQADPQEIVEELFVPVLQVTDPKLYGEVQVAARAWRQRARHVIDNKNFRFVSNLCFFFCALAMLLLPYARPHDGWKQFLESVIIVNVVFTSVEFFLYGVGHGVLPRISQPTMSLASVRAVLAVWLPARLRQVRSTFDEKLIARPPLLQDVKMVGELFLVVLSFIGYTLPTRFGIHRMRYLHGVRCLRLVTPLSHAMPACQCLIKAFQSVAMLASTILLLLFFFLVFGVMGVDQFQAQASQRCFLVDPHLDVNFSDIENFSFSDICLPDSSDHRFNSCIEAYPPLFCDAQKSDSSDLYSCGEPMVCRAAEAPNFGYTTFDNILAAWLSLFHIASLSKWSAVMYSIWAGKMRLLVGIYCVLLIVAVSFIVFNLVKAIITSTYAAARAAPKETSVHGSRQKVSSFLAFVAHELFWARFGESIVWHLTFVPEERIENKDDPELDGAVRKNLDRKPFFMHTRFQILRNLLLFAVVVMFGINGAHMPSGYHNVLTNVAIIYIILFSIEILLSILASGCIGRYFFDDVHKFDFTLLVLSFIGMFYGAPLFVLRSLRIVRIGARFKFLQRSNVLEAAKKAYGPCVAVTVFIVVCILVMAAVAMAMFGSRKGEGGTFDNLTEAIMAILRIVAVDRWEELMYSSMAGQNWVLGLAFFIPAYLLFSLMLSTLFMAVILDAFEVPTEDKVEMQQKEYDAKQRKIAAARRRAKGITRTLSLTRGVSVGSFSPDEQETTRSFGGGLEGAASGSVAFRRRFTQPMKDASFAFFTVDSKVRQFLMKLIIDPSDVPPANLKDAPKLHGNIFQWAIAVVIVLSCIQAAVHPPSEACSTRRDESISDNATLIFLISDIVFVIIFTVEMLAKMVVQGVVFPGDDRPAWIGPTYFRDVWNVLDFALLVAMFVSFWSAEARALRVFRTIRTLRVVRRFENMRILGRSVVKSLPSIATVWFFIMYVVFMFAIVGVGMFSGKMDYCVTSAIGGQAVVSRNDCKGFYFNKHGVLAPAAWVKPVNNFDNAGSAMGYLVQVCSLSEWAKLIDQALAVKGEDLQPEKHQSLYLSVFFFFFVVFVTFILANLIVGILITCLDEQRGLLFLTRQQRDFTGLMKEIESLKPIKPPPVSRFPRVLAFVSKKWFEIVINIAVLVNILLLASQHRDQNDNWTSVLRYSNIFFLVVFVIELLLKLMAMGKHYFSDGWNLIDFVVVVGSGFETLYGLAQGSQDIAITSAARALRILRIFRYVTRVGTLRALFHTLQLALPAVLPVLAFIFILLFMFAVLFMILFGGVRFQESVNRDANFRRIDIAWLTLFRMMTFDGWNSIMNDLRMHVAPYCSQSQLGHYYFDVETGDSKSCGVLDDCSSVFAQFYFYLFYSIAAYFLQSVIVVIMLDNFTYISRQTRMPIRLEHLDSYRMCWLRLKRREGSSDLHYDEYIEHKYLPGFVIDLFNKHNALVNTNREELDIHPVMTSISRLRYRKLEFELQHEAVKRQLPEGQEYSFTNILVVCARMQLGKECLTVAQRQSREVFDERCSLALVGHIMRHYFVRSLTAARERIANRTPQTESLQDGFHTTVSWRSEPFGGDDTRRSSDGSPAPDRRERILRRVGHAPIPCVPVAEPRNIGETLPPKGLMRDTTQTYVQESLHDLPDAEYTMVSLPPLDPNESHEMQLRDPEPKNLDGWDFTAPQHSTAQSNSKPSSSPEAEGRGAAGSLPVESWSDIGQTLRKEESFRTHASISPTLIPRHRVSPPRPGPRFQRHSSFANEKMAQDERAKRAFIASNGLEGCILLRLQSVEGSEAIARRFVLHWASTRLEAARRAFIESAEAEQRRNIATECRVRAWSISSAQITPLRPPKDTDFSVIDLDDEMLAPVPIPRVQSVGRSMSSASLGGTSIASAAALHQRQRSTLEAPWARSPSASHSHGVRSTPNPIPELFPPMCPNDIRCKEYNVFAHIRQYRHTCRAGADCPLHLDSTHMRLYAHRNVGYL